MQATSRMIVGVVHEDVLETLRTEFLDQFLISTGMVCFSLRKRISRVLKSRISSGIPGYGMDPVTNRVLTRATASPIMTKNRLAAVASGSTWEMSTSTLHFQIL